MRLRLALHGLTAVAAWTLVAAPAHAFVVRAKLACKVSPGVILTNTSNYWIPRGATLDVAVTSGKYQQHFSRTLPAAEPIGAAFSYGAVLLVLQSGATSTCTASASWRLPGPFR